MKKKNEKVLVIQKWYRRVLFRRKILAHLKIVVRRKQIWKIIAKKAELRIKKKAWLYIVNKALVE